MTDYAMKPCFICGSIDACRHREPELLAYYRTARPVVDPSPLVQKVRGTIYVNVTNGTHKPRV